MAMSSFARENEASLTDFFNGALQVREQFVLVAEGLSAFSMDTKEQARLSELYAPILSHPIQILKGIHAHAFVFDSCVVKTNLFGPYPQEGQRQWLEWCNAHQDNPLVPKVAFLITDEVSDRYLVVMERLECHSGFIQHEYRKDIDQCFVQSFRGRPMVSYPELSKALVDIKKNSELAVVELNADIQLMKEIDDKEVERQLETSLMEHKVALQYIKEIEIFWTSLRTVNRTNYSSIRSFWNTLVQKGHVIDLHGFNWMLRRNGEQVLLDPVN